MTHWVHCWALCSALHGAWLSTSFTHSHSPGAWWKFCLWGPIFSYWRGFGSFHNFMTVSCCTMPLTVGCFVYTDLLCQARDMAFSRVRSNFICIFSESRLSCIPTTIWSLIILSCKALYPQCFTKVYRLVMKLSTGSVSPRFPHIQLGAFEYGIAMLNKIFLKLMLYCFVALFVANWGTTNQYAEVSQCSQEFEQETIPS